MPVKNLQRLKRGSQQLFRSLMLRKSNPECLNWLNTLERIAILARLIIPPGLILFQLSQYMASELLEQKPT